MAGVSIIPPLPPAFGCERTIEEVVGYRRIFALQAANNILMIEKAIGCSHHVCARHHLRHIFRNAA
jgi:hypothetical protein